MPLPPSSPRPARTPFWILAVTLLTLTALLGLTACNSEEKGPHLALSAAVPDKVPEGTVLHVGDPATETALKLSGLDDQLDIDVEWANISGGPKTLEAFRAGAIDVGSVADIPPLFAQWTGTPIKILAARTTVDPLDHPTYELGVAPGQHVSSLKDLKGLKIAYSPGQAQGALVLRLLEKEGLSQDDVDLVEMQSVDDSFVNALASKQVDVAPLGQALVRTYLAKYKSDGATTLKPGIRDDAWSLYAPTEVVEDANKAAALKKYVAIWAKAQQWISDHPEEFAKGFYEEHEGLSAEDAAYVVKALGKFEVPTNWDDVIARHQRTADLLAEKQGHERLDMNTLYDRRFEKAIREAIGGTSPSDSASPSPSGGKTENPSGGKSKSPSGSSS